jgi:Uncharacterized protein conserved in bacteria
MIFLHTHKTTILTLLVLAVLFGVWLFARSPEQAEAPEHEGVPEMGSATQQEAMPQAGEAAPSTDAQTDTAEVVLTTPQEGETVTSPLTVSGEALGYWYFEADFPLIVVDWDGKILGEGYATAQRDWMTAEPVPFEGTVSFDVAQISGNYSRNGTLILQKANPSGLPEHSAAIEVPIVFGE